MMARQILNAGFLLLITLLVAGVGCLGGSNSDGGPYQGSCPQGSEYNPVTGKCQPRGGGGGDTGFDASDTNGTLEDSGGQQDTNTGGDDTGTSILCDTGLDVCSGQCVDLNTNPDYCGNCNTSCTSDQQCVNGTCSSQPIDCREEACVGFTYCNLSTGECKDGCASASQCGDNEVCDVSTHACKCDTGYHDCSGTCVPDDSIDTCGDRCSTCPSTADTNAFCIDSQCKEMEKFTAVHAGEDHTCAIQVSGTVACWGREAEGQAVDQTDIFKQLDAGEDHNCGVLDDDTVFCWGGNDYDQATAPTGTFSQVSAGARHSCGVTTSGDLECWGSEWRYGTIPTSDTYTQVAAGNYHNCALTSAQEIVCWGDDGYDKLDAPTTGTYDQITAGWRHTCALATDGTVDCWGGSKTANSPTGTFTQISCEAYDCCGLKDDQSAHCWAMGNDTAPDDKPGPFIQVTAGEDFACGVDADGFVECWGSDSYGQATPPSP